MHFKSAIDDSTPEQLAYCHTRLLELGAADVYFNSIYMKKNRPAYELTVLCQPELEQIITETIFQETTSIDYVKPMQTQYYDTRSKADTNWFSNH